MSETLYVGDYGTGRHPRCIGDEPEELMALSGLPEDRIYVVEEPSRADALRAAMGEGDLSGLPRLSELRRRELLTARVVAAARARAERDALSVLIQEGALVGEDLDEARRLLGL